MNDTLCAFRALSSLNPKGSASIVGALTTSVKSGAAKAVCSTKVRHRGVEDVPACVVAHSGMFVAVK
jgi:hypothetical protein